MPVLFRSCGHVVFGLVACAFLFESCLREHIVVSPSTNESAVVYLYRGQFGRRLKEEGFKNLAVYMGVDDLCRC